MNLKTEFRNRLIKPTIENAAQIPFYRAIWPESVKDKIMTVNDLALIPIVDKALYQQRYEDNLPEGQMPAIVSHSTGTTGHMSFRYRGADEIEYIRDFFGGVQQKISVSADQIPLILTIAGNYHGNKIPLPGNAYALEAGVGEKTELDQISQLLQKNFRIPRVAPRITQIQSSLYAIKLVTFALIEEGIQPSSLAVRILVHTGEHVSPMWKEFIEKAWNARLVNRYSLSEIFGGATLCMVCENYHVDPHVVPEIIDPFTQATIRDGVGILVLSELYPFVQYQPLIRYSTGDLVEAVESECDPGNPSFRLLGRYDFAIVDQSDSPAVLITPSSLHDILDEIPDVEKESLFTHIPGLSNYEFGEPLSDFSITKGQADETEVMIRVGCTFNVVLHRERALQIKKLVRDGLMAKNAELKIRVEDGRCKLTVHSVNRSTLKPHVMA